MGMFTQGYQDGVKSVTKKLDQEEISKIINEMSQNGLFDELEEWLNGLYKGILDVQIEALHMMKKETLQE